MSHKLQADESAQDKDGLDPLASVEHRRVVL